MSDTDPDLDRLQDLLAAIPPEREGMNVVELDGYVAALIVCPDTILPSEGFRGSGAKTTPSRILPTPRRLSAR